MEKGTGDHIPGASAQILQSKPETLLTQILEGKSSEGGHVDEEDVLSNILTKRNVQTFSQGLGSVLIHGAVYSLVT